MKHKDVFLIFSGVLFAGLANVTWGHDVITTKITFDREIIRIVHARCASCHREGGSAFSIMTYDEARPWAKAMQEEVLERRMPPWGAVKGFGEFRDDQALTPEQINAAMRRYVDPAKISIFKAGDFAKNPPAK